MNLIILVNSIFIIDAKLIIFITIIIFFIKLFYVHNQDHIFMAKFNLYLKDFHHQILVNYVFVLNSPHLLDLYFILLPKYYIIDYSSKMYND